jgi:hypothetical protein
MAGCWKTLQNAAWGAFGMVEGEFQFPIVQRGDARVGSPRGVRKGGTRKLTFHLGVNPSFLFSGTPLLAQTKRRAVDPPGQLLLRVHFRAGDGSEPPLVHGQLMATPGQDFFAREGVPRNLNFHIGGNPDSRFSGTPLLFALLAKVSIVRTDTCLADPFFKNLWQAHYRVVFVPEGSGAEAEETSVVLPAVSPPP